MEFKAIIHYSDVYYKEMMERHFINKKPFNKITDKIDMYIRLELYDSESGWLKVTKYYPFVDTVEKEALAIIEGMDKDVPKYAKRISCEAYCWKRITKREFDMRALDNCQG